MTSVVVELLQSWLERHLSTAIRTWLDDRMRATRDGDTQAFFLAFGMIPRKTGKSLLILSTDDCQLADTAVPGWNPSLWSIDQAARTLLVLQLPTEPQSRYVEILDRSFAAGEVGELVALYQSLALLPHPEAHRLRAAEGIRSSIRTVFGAVSQNNPYPASQLEEGPFNQMVLKCLFVGLPLDPIVGLDARANPPLARMLLDYAHERWAAKRAVSPELWRPISRFVDDAVLADLQKVLETGELLEQQAATLTLLASGHPNVSRSLDRYGDLSYDATHHKFDWSTIAQQWLNSLRG